MAAHQAPPSLGFSRQEHWSGLPFPSPMHESESEVAQSCPTLSDPMDCSPPGSSVHGIFQSRDLEWVAIAFSCIPFSNYLWLVFLFTKLSYQLVIPINLSIIYPLFSTEIGLLWMARKRELKYRIINIMSEINHMYKSVLHIQHCCRVWKITKTTWTIYNVHVITFKLKFMCVKKYLMHSMYHLTHICTIMK